MKKIRVALCALTVGLGVLAVPSPAMASAWSCPAGFLCVYKDANGQGSRWTWLGGDEQLNFNDGTKYFDGTSLNDSISSIFNNSNYAAKFCTDKNFGGHCLVYPAHSKTAQVYYNEQYSSMTTV